MLSEEEFAALFRTFGHTAYRLEVRDRYNSPRETEPYQRFLAGTPDDLSWYARWLEVIRAAVETGRTIRRVRVVSVPFTDYTRFGLWASEVAVDAGEDIRYLARPAPPGLPDHDYWLFDSRTLVRLDFDAADRLLSPELVSDPTEIVHANFCRDLALHHARPRADFLRAFPEPKRPATH